MGSDGLDMSSKGAGKENTDVFVEELDAKNCSVKRGFLGRVLEIMHLGQQFRHPKCAL